MKNFAFVVVLLVSINSCELKSEKPPKNEHIPTSEELFIIAGKLAGDNKADTAFKVLVMAFEKGYQNKMGIVGNSYFRPLIDNPETRPEVRRILQRYSDQSEAVMVHENEPGVRIKIKGLIIDSESGDALPDVSIELIQTDENGLYFEEKSQWNPRLFAYLKSNENGEFLVETIRPGSYEDDEGMIEAEHMHFNLRKEKFYDFNSEFVFADSPYFQSEEIEEGELIAKKDENGNYTLIIPMERE